MSASSICFWSLCSVSVYWCQMFRDMWWPHTDLWVVGMAGLWAPPGLLWLHPVTLHSGVMFRDIKEARLLTAGWETWQTETWKISGHMTSVFLSFWTLLTGQQVLNVLSAVTLSATRWRSDWTSEGYIWSLWAPAGWVQTDESSRSQPGSRSEPSYCPEPAAPRTSWNTVQFTDSHSLYLRFI